MAALAFLSGYGCTGIATAQSASPPPRYAITDLKPPAPDRLDSLAKINNAGQVLWAGDQGTFRLDGGTWNRIGDSHFVGASMSNSGDIIGRSNGGISHAFLYSNGTMRDLGTYSNGSFSGGYGINDNGECLVYSSINGDAGNSPFYWKGGTFVRITPLPTPPYDFSVTAAGGACINNAGQVAAMSNAADGSSHLFIWTKDGAKKDLGTAPAPYDGYAVPQGINDAGAVVGYCHNIATGKDHAFLYSGTALADIGTLGGDFSRATAINASGQVVGFSTTASGSGAAFLYQNGTMYDLNSLIPKDSGWVLTEAISINDKGQIVGYGTYQGQGQAFLLSLEDSDGDGIPDDWERNGGFYFDGNWVDLPAGGDKPDPNHKDIYIWVDYMEESHISPDGTVVVDHSERPDSAALDMIRQAFANAPVTNLDGTTGINLHVIIAEKPVTFKMPDGTLTTHVDMLGTYDGAVKSYDWSAFKTIKEKYSAFPKGWSSFCHYCLFAHDYMPDHSTGISLLNGFYGGSDFLVTLGNYKRCYGDSEYTKHGGSISYQAGTFMHELGHNLGLGHGGPAFEAGAMQHAEQVNANYKPNYLSVMNYSFQLNGLIYKGHNQVFDYSRFKLNDLDEYHLNELVPLSSDPEAIDYGTIWFCNPTLVITDDLHLTIHYKQAKSSSVTWPINWNQNFDIFRRDIFETDIAANLNKDLAIGSLTDSEIFNIPCKTESGDVIEPLHSYRDWPNLNFRGGSIGSGGVIWQPTITAAGEADQQTLSAIKPIPPSGVSARAATKAVRLGWNPLGSLNEWQYTVYRSTDGVNFTPIGKTTTAVFNDGALTSRQVYYYYVTGTNTLGSESFPSTTVSAIPH